MLYEVITQRRTAEELKLAVLPESKEKENRRKSLDNELVREENESSRLFVIDAGLDSAALRTKYPDRARYAIVQGVITSYSIHYTKLYEYRHSPPGCRTRAPCAYSR